MFKNINDISKTFEFILADISKTRLYDQRSENQK